MVRHFLDIHRLEAAELRAILDYNQSLVDFATAQEVPVR